MVSSELDLPEMWSLIRSSYQTTNCWSDPTSKKHDKWPLLGLQGYSLLFLNNSTCDELASLLSSPCFLTEVIKINLAMSINLTCNVGSLLQLRVRMLLEHCVDNADDCFMWTNSISSRQLKSMEQYPDRARYQSATDPTHALNCGTWAPAGSRSNWSLRVSWSQLLPFLHHENPPTSICCAYCRSTCCNHANLENLSCLLQERMI